VNNIEALSDNKKFSWTATDVEDFHWDDDVDYIFHLASPASPKDYMECPLSTLTANTEGTHNLLSIAEHLNAKFVYASTSEVYGNPQEHPQKETYYGNVNCVGPRSCYDESKRCGEAFCMAFHNIGTDVKIARIFNTYGPRMKIDDGRAIPNFITQALKDLPLTVCDGNQTRSFCYVDDLVHGLVTLALKGKSGEAYNIGNPKEMRIVDLAEKISDMIGCENREMRYCKMPKDDPYLRRPDITKIKKLGWRPTTNLTTGLKKTIEWFTQEMASQNEQKIS